MSASGGFDYLSTKEQAEIIRSVGVQVAERQTAFCRMELYALDTLFIEFSFTRYYKASSLKGIRYINHLAGLEPYLNEIKLPLS